MVAFKYLKNSCRIYNFERSHRGGSPVPIPNTVVKLLRANGTTRATERESRSALIFITGQILSGQFFII